MNVHAILHSVNLYFCFFSSVCEPKVVCTMCTIYFYAKKNILATVKLKSKDHTLKT